MPLFFQALSPAQQKEFFNMFDTVTQKSLFFYLAPALKVEFAANKTFDGLLQFLGDLSPADQFLNIAAFDESYQRNFLGRLSPQQLFSTLTSVPAQYIAQIFKLNNPRSFGSMLNVLAPDQKVALTKTLASANLLGQIASLPADSLNPFVSSLPQDSKGLVLQAMSDSSRKSLQQYEQSQTQSSA